MIFRTRQFNRANWAAHQVAVRHNLPKPDLRTIQRVVVFLSSQNSGTLLEWEQYADELREHAAQYDRDKEALDGKTNS
ncbi:MAG: hypothetical protein A2W25_11650 [candidate division Zixibacteria bacterium RBG_16_53_22]|nr:MAG: hypothetical protein A2W25_11650 [candidate division Zixibacteria bacterium RBG_16_53_22]